MKLCPQCEFIYEDYQRCCDMDGTELVYDPKIEQFLANLVEVKSEVSRKSPRLRRVVPVVIVTLILAAAVSTYVGYNRRDSHPIITPVSAGDVTSESTPSNSPVPLPTNEPIVIPSTETAAGIANTQTEIPKPRDKSARDANNPARLSESRIVAARKAPPALSVKSLPRVEPLPRLKPLPKVEENRKKESRVGSFLKKTGRILSKPFKR